MATITINGQLVLDQTAGIQADDLDVTSTGGVLAGLDSDFMTFLNGLGLTATQKNFAAFVDGASEPDLVSVSAATGETVKSLFFSDASGNDLAGTLVPGVTLLDGSPLYMWSADGGHVVIISTSSTAGFSADTIAAAFYIEPNATNTEALVQSITFVPLLHPDATNPNDPVDFSDILNVSAAVVLTKPVGDDIIVLDDAPTISTSGTPTVINVDETHLGVSNHANYGPLFVKDWGTDGQNALTPISYSLDFGIGSVGLVDEETNEAISLSKTGGVIFGKNTDGATVFTISVDSTGDVTFTQLRSVTHDPDSGPDQTAFFSTAGLITLTATLMDGDGDTNSATLNIGKSFSINDDAPTLTVPVSYIDPADTFLKVGNQAGQSATGHFGYNIGADDHLAAFYGTPTNGSDFTDMSLVATVSATGDAINETVTRASEDLHQATFNWSFDYDSDPLTSGFQSATASGTLVFDKDADTFTITDNTAVSGFSQTIVHTSEFIAKEPTSNVGHPNIVVEQLAADNPNTPAHEGFFVQFTGNNSPFSFTSNGQGSSNDTTYNSAPTVGTHDMFASANETWVSATQDTNGVAGDTIQKGEALTLRFFDTNPHIAVEALQPTQVADDVVMKFDGIGNSEDLMVNLSLIDFGADGVRGGGDDTTITRAVYVENQDIYKHSTPGGIPAPYNAEFSLDNNDGLVIIESNDYNAAGEHYHIEAMQILQSANGLSGLAINLNKAVGSTGGSNATSGLQQFDPTDNDVLKITDIGFVQTTTTSGTQSANLDFSFNIADGDLDLLGVQHISAQLNTGFIV